MESIWSASSHLPQFPRLEENIKTDVLIIGGGMAGLLCAYELQQAGVPYVLVEAKRICSGVTANTTAKITAQHGLVYHKLVSKFGIEKAAQYLQANQAALENYRRLCREIDCDFEEKDAYVYSVDRPKKLDAELEALQRIGFSAELVEDVPLPLETAGAIRFPGQAQFHPLKFAAGIALGLNIFEHSPVQAFNGNVYQTDRGGIRAKKTIIATHFPIFNKHGLFPLKLYQHRSYVIALENAADVRGMYVDERKTGLSFRNQGNYLLLSGGAHRTGKKGGGWTDPEAFASAHFPLAHEEFRWATQDCMSLDGVPYIGLYSENTPNLFVATGFNKWGMTSSMAAASLLCDLVQEKKNAFTDLYSPQRSVLHPQLAANVFQATMNLLTPTLPRCPHMGCALKWNPQEHSWDCPCHGSRFSKSGELLENPSTGNLKNPPKQ